MALLATATATRSQCVPQWNLNGGDPGFNGQVNDLLQLPGGLFACGNFSSAGGVAVQNVARWNGTAWQAVGSLGSSLSEVRVLAVMNNGNLLAGGSILVGPLGSAAHLSVFDGSGWSQAAGGQPFGPGNTGVHALTVLPNGDVIVGGYFTYAGWEFSPGIGRWDGSNWSGLGGGLGLVEALATRPDGSVIAGGDFVRGVGGGVLANRIAMWNGIRWNNIGSGMNDTVRCIHVLPNGDFLVGGDFTTANGVAANGIARFNYGSSTPVALGAGLTGYVKDIRTLPDGDIVAVGGFQVVGNPGINFIARFDTSTSTWGPVAPNGSLTTTGYALELTTADELAVAANATAGAATSQGFARIVSGCPALATSYGAGCTGPGGALSLIASPRPWTGATSVLRATGFGPTSLGIVVLGFTQTNAPLSSVPDFVGIAGPTCLALTTPDVWFFVSPVAGEVSWELPIPNTPALAGAVAFNQGVELEVGGTSFSFAGSTNGVQFTIGTF